MLGGQPLSSGFDPQAFDECIGTIRTNQGEMACNAGRVFCRYPANKAMILPAKRKGPPRPVPRRPSRAIMSPGSVAIMVRLERPRDRDADIVGLALAELGQLDAELVEMERGDLLVEMLGKNVEGFPICVPLR